MPNAFEVGPDGNVQPMASNDHSASVSEVPRFAGSGIDVAHPLEEEGNDDHHRGRGRS